MDFADWLSSMTGNLVANLLALALAAWFAHLFFERARQAKIHMTHEVVYFSQLHSRAIVRMANFSAEPIYDVHVYLNIKGPMARQIIWRRFPAADGQQVWLGQIPPGVAILDLQEELTEEEGVAACWVTYTTIRGRSYVRDLSKVSTSRVERLARQLRPGRRRPARP